MDFQTFNPKFVNLDLDDTYLFHEDKLLMKLKSTEPNIQFKLNKVHEHTIIKLIQ